MATRAAAADKAAAIKPARKPRQREFSAKTMSQDLRVMAMTSLNMVGGVKYLNAVARSDPKAYLAFIARCLVKDDGADLGSVQFVVQQITVTATPVPGVINSPVAEHVAPLRLAASGGEVVDVEATARD